MPRSEATAGEVWSALNGQTARLDQSQGRTDDLISLAETCQAQQQAVARALKPQPWWKFGN